MAITASLSRSPGLLNRGPNFSGTCSSFQLQLLKWVLVFSTASYLQLIWTSCAPSNIIIWRPLFFFLRASQFRTQFNPSTVKVISWYSSTGCTCFLHRCISYFDSLAGVNMLQKIEKENDRESKKNKEENLKNLNQRMCNEQMKNETKNETKNVKRFMNERRKKEKCQKERKKDIKE